MNMIKLLAQAISGGIVQCATDPCTLCDLYILADRFTRFLLFNVMLPIAALMILIGGVMLLTARDNQQKQTQGKAVLSYAVWGMIIAFAAWLIVTTFLTTLGYKATWYDFPTCQAGGGEGNNQGYCIFNGVTRCTLTSCNNCAAEGAEGCSSTPGPNCNGDKIGYCIFGRVTRCTQVSCNACANEGAEGCSSTKGPNCN